MKPFLKRYCERCHNVEKRTSGVRVDHLDPMLEDRHLKMWEGVRKQISSEAMPPEDEPEPTAVERGRMNEWITQALRWPARGRRPKTAGRVG